MKVSIVTVSFNSRDTIRDTIESVLSQTHDEIEYIVVDGGSTDGTREIVLSYGPRISHFICERDNGIYDAMNKGLRTATGHVVGYLNSDDFYSGPAVIAKVAKHFEDATHLDCLFADLILVHPKRVEKVVRLWKSSAYKPGRFHSGWHPAHPTFFAKAHLLRKLGGFDESFRISADFELMLRALAVENARSLYVPQVLVTMRAGGESNRSLTNIWRANLECLRAFRKNNLRVTPLIVFRKPLSKLLQYIAAVRHRQSIVSRPLH